MVTVAQERAALARVPGRPVLRRREQWRSSFPYTGRWTVQSPATRVFIHISVTNPAHFNGNDAHARGLEAIGRSRFPRTGVSYNRGCMPNAQLYELQPMGRQGAHTVNDRRRSRCSTSGCPGRGGALSAPGWNLNVNARAYVICQNVQHAVTAGMVDALARQIVADVHAGLVTRAAALAIHGHRCVSAKSCPGDRMWAQMGALQTRIRQYLDRGLPRSQQEDDDMVAPRHWTSADQKAVRRTLFGDERTWQNTPIKRTAEPFDADEDRNVALLLRNTALWASRLPGIDRELRALVEMLAGSDAPTVLAKLDELGAEQSAAIEAMERGVMAALDKAEQQREVLLSLVEAVGSGERDAADVVDEIGRRLRADENIGVS